MAHIDDMTHQIRKARAEEDEQRSCEYISRLAAHGIRSEAGTRYGDTHIAIRFDDVERVLVLLGRTPGDNRDAFKPRAAEQTYEFGAVEVDDGPEVPPRGKR